MASTLLLADPNPTIQKLVAMTFAGQDFTVVSVSDGEEAMSAIAADRPDVVLADVSMPRRSGYDVAAFVKQRPDLAHIPVLLLAGALDPVDEARAAEARCDGVVVKPFEPQQVVARVRELMRGGPGNPTQATRGVPRPIERLVEPRVTAAPPAAPAPVGPVPAAKPDPVPVDPLDDLLLRQPPPKVVKHPSAAAAPAGPTAAADADPLGDYFDQLDAAFGTIDPPAPASMLADVREDETERLEVPTLTSVLGEFGRDPVPAPPDPLGFKEQILFGGAQVDPPDIRSVPPPAVTLRDPSVFRPAMEPPPEPPAGEPPRVDARVEAPPRVGSAFDALVAADDEDRAARRAREQAAAEAAGNDALVEAVAARVMEKLAPDGVTDLVSRVVADVAERLVREEIDRIRGRK